MIEDEIVVTLLRENPYDQRQISCEAGDVTQIFIRYKQGIAVGATVILKDKNYGDIEGEINAEDLKILDSYPNIKREKKFILAEWTQETFPDPPEIDYDFMEELGKV
jgi:hypothetical protein